jgi:hypothetical protein
MDDALCDDDQGRMLCNQSLTISSRSFCYVSSSEVKVKVKGKGGTTMTDPNMLVPPKFIGSIDASTKL